MKKPVIVVVMGVSGAGKTTIGLLLATALGCDFQDGDALHPAENIEKMRRGMPLDDTDRSFWLRRVADVIDAWHHKGISGVIACSALKRSHRNMIIGRRDWVTLVYLQGSYDLIHRRMLARHEHFMPVALLDSQFSTLEEPLAAEHPITVSVDQPPLDIVQIVTQQMEPLR